MGQDNHTYKSYQLHLEEIERLAKLIDISPVTLGGALSYAKTKVKIFNCQPDTLFECLMASSDLTEYQASIIVGYVYRKEIERIKAHHQGV